jgi:hypothetical protein
MDMHSCRWILHSVRVLVMTCSMAMVLIVPICWDGRHSSLVKHVEQLLLASLGWLDVRRISRKTFALLTPDGKHYM